MATGAADPRTVLAEIEAADRLLVQQVFKPIANEYRISVPAPGSTNEGPPLLFVKQKKMKIKPAIRFRPSPDDDAHLFMIKSKSVFEFRGRHEVLDANGAVIGLLEKDFRLAPSCAATGTCGRRPARELLEAHEASWIVALLRRLGDIGPDLFSLLEMAALQLPAPPRRRAGRERTSACSARCATATCSRSGSSSAGVDRRLLVAFAIGLDALQDR